MVIICAQALAHDIEFKKFSGGLYKENAFEYPASLTEENLEIVLKEISLVTSDLVLEIKQNGDHLYAVVTCTKRESSEGECKSGKSYLFGQGEVAFSNFTITPASIEFIVPKTETGDLVKALKYSFGRYENVPFTYPSTLSKEQIELVIGKLLDQTQHEISSVHPSRDYSVYPSREKFSTYTITTCTTGARIKHYCDSGESYEFDLNTYEINKVGGWVQ
jgi:hypothetical protein